MLDDMSTLRGAVDDYRAAAVAAGIAWVGDGDRAGDLSPDELCRVFGVGRIPEQALWLVTDGLPYGRILPDGAHPMRWNDVDELLDSLSFAVGIPFPWRQQLPLFSFDHLVFTFVLAEAYEGEIWRYQIDADDWNPMRASPGLVALLTEWTKGFGAGVYQRSEYDDWLHADDDVLRSRGLDPFAFPVHVSQYPDDTAIRARQRECGVDVGVADDPDRQADLLDEIDAVRASLR